MPFKQEHLDDVCVCCGKKADKMVVWEDNTNNKKNIISKCKAVIKSRKIFTFNGCFVHVIRVNVIHIKNTTKNFLETICN